MTMPKGYKLPEAEKKRLEKIEKEHDALRNKARGFDVYQERRQQAQRKQDRRFALLIVGLCMVPVLIVAAAITLNWYLIGAFLVVYAVIAGFAFFSSEHNNNTLYAAGHYWAASRGRNFRMYGAHKATRRRG